MRYTQRLPEQKERRYWLIDPARLPEGEVLRCFYATTHQPMFRWLYDGTAFQAVRDSGPVLLDITQDDSVWQQFSTEWTGQVASVVIDTSESLNDLQQRLSAHLTIDTPGKGKGLLRFHEPAALHLLLGEALLSPPNRMALMGGDVCWTWPLCRYEESIVLERHISPRSTNATLGGALRLDVDTQQRLSGVSQFSRLMPVLGEAIQRFDLMQTDVGITSLWRALECYWCATWQDRLPRRQAVEMVQGMLLRSGTLERLIEELVASSKDASPLNAKTR
ncbi:protein of unknown function [Franzmannia pantelleriensis]|uniref:DUF4123 domain-containing protein n=1 Tax=Franzmannia pantelleriensis TaxID=48727 RepID=A0A1G9RZE3_9GAMM|nr:DUF4123 domain-containing protein [Halomonas pantelleriensis]SDM28380.1 protein of unknown function [Halomonas pantelleriensis]